ncbi:hypothetical protein BpHYR1_006951 [Brachionus plicatilis]|uniref:Uncharacterized protein n=1 Tax=Brachionus plicatilis TaxID=10195 RepID=A0A3M7QIA2_BRAPC|nr:hypothetical protein BpHYR1_006951 [Brachionus plicatilis]
MQIEKIILENKIQSKSYFDLLMTCKDFLTFIQPKICIVNLTPPVLRGTKNIIRLLRANTGKKENEPKLNFKIDGRYQHRKISHHHQTQYSVFSGLVQWYEHYSEQRGPIVEYLVSCFDQGSLHLQKQLILKAARKNLFVQPYQLGHASAALHLVIALHFFLSTLRASNKRGKNTEHFGEQRAAVRVAQKNGPKERLIAKGHINAADAVGASAQAHHVLFAQSEHVVGRVVGEDAEQIEKSILYEPLLDVFVGAVVGQRARLKLRLLRLQVDHWGCGRCWRRCTRRTRC